ncbi:hypothetical protein ACFL0Z_02275 [Patescibacteria group bacterium]
MRNAYNVAKRLKKDAEPVMDRNHTERTNLSNTFSCSIVPSTGSVVEVILSGFVISALDGTAVRHIPNTKVLNKTKANNEGIQRTFFLNSSVPLLGASV